MPSFIPSILLVLTLLLTPAQGADPGSGAAEGIAWMEFEEAVTRVESELAAGQTPRMIFVEIYAVWCPYCKRLDSTTMTDPDVIAMLNEHFYPVRFDGETKRSIDFSGYTFDFVPNGESGYHELAAGLAGGALSYPTLVFINEDLKVVQPLPGYRPADELLPILSFFGERHYLNTPWNTFIESYEAASDR